MPLSPDTVSAFAAYSGLSGNLTKKQRRRKNKIKNNISALSAAENSHGTVSTEIEKKRKTEESINKDVPKFKKQKVNDISSEDLKWELIQINRHKIVKPILKKKTQKLKNKSKVKNSAFINGQLAVSTGDVEKEKKEFKEDVVKEPNKTKKVTRKNRICAPPEIKLLTEEQVKQEIERNAKVNNIKKVKFNKVKIAKKKKKSNELVETVSQEENRKIEDELQRQIDVPTGSVTDLVGKACVNQENESTMISKINKLKKDLAAEEICRSTKPSHESIVHQQKRLSEKMRGSEDIGRELFEKIISPCGDLLFFKNYWEKTPLYIPGTTKKFSSLMSTQLIDDFLRQKVVMFGKHIDITSYKDGKRETHNLEGRALPHVVWDFYNHKCSVRLLCPQAAFSNVFVMNTKLQDYFGCFVGANAYLTPPNSQGFAPHYDDIEAFVLQIEGQKRWKIYNPRNKFETLPRYSSKNFTPSEVGKPILEVTLKPGDLLYFPRGFIHQADTSTSHSLHLTISVYQKNSWVDLLEKALPLALSKAAKEEVDLRRGLPLHFLRQAGLAYHSPTLRKVLIKNLKQKMLTLLRHIDIDSAVDMMGVQYITDALPPVLTPEEASRCTIGNGLRMESNGQLKGSVAFEGDTKVRFTTASCYRLVKEKVKSEDGLEEEDEIRLYYTIDNSREYHGEEPQFVVIPEEYVPAIKMLSVNYPLFIAVKSLPLPSLDEQATLVGDLWDRGILMTEEPLEEQQVIESNNGLCEANNIVEDNEEVGTARFSHEENQVSNEYEDSIEEEEEEEDDEITDVENNDDKPAREYDKAVSDVEKFISVNDEIEEYEDSTFDELSTDYSNSSSDSEEEFSSTDSDEFLMGSDT